MIRAVTPEDSARWYALRNAPDIRFWSLQGGPIPPGNHALWWEHVLARPESQYLALAEYSDPETPDGYVRGHRAVDVEISVGVRAGARQRGIGRALLAHVESEMLGRGAERLVAYIHGSNLPSVTLFQRAGFTICNPGCIQVAKTL